MVRFREDSIHKKNEKQINVAGLRSGRVSQRAMQNLINNPELQNQALEIVETLQTQTTKDK